MTALLLLAAAAGAVFGWSACDLHHRRRAREAARHHARLAASCARLAADNQRLAHWCDRFRDLYLGALEVIDPIFAAEQRRKWAAAQSPEAVRRVLERAGSTAAPGDRP